MSDKTLNIDYIPFCDIQAARERLASRVPTSPLVRLQHEVPGKKIYLKLENLLPTKCYKVRGATNALLCLNKEQRAMGVWAPSSGNFAQSIAWGAKQLSIPCTFVVPDHTPQTKMNPIRARGGDILKVSYDDWWQAMMTHRHKGINGHMLHPACEYNVIAGYGTAGIEIVEALPDVDTVICPFGAGGLSCGIASALRALKPSAQVFVCEVETAAPLAASRTAGRPVMLSDHQTSFVDGMGGKSVLPDMWQLVSSLLQPDPVVLSLRQVADAVRLLLEKNSVLAEGAGAATVAAALTDQIPEGNIVCVVSGGNIDVSPVTSILNGEIPHDESNAT